MKRWLIISAFLLGLIGALLYTYHASATVNEVTAANRYTGNGSTTVFAYGFKILSSADIEVLVDSTVKTLTTDYTVSGVGASGGGSVTFVTAPVNATVVTLLRKQPAAQSSVYTPNEAFPSTRLEKDLDKLEMQVQQVREQLNRSLHFGKSSIQSSAVDEPSEGAFARAKAGGGVDWATAITANGCTSLPIPINQGGTGVVTAAAALTALGASAIEPADSAFRVAGSGDATKKVAFEVDGITTATTRTVTIPNRSFTIGPTLATEQPSTSGTFIDFLSIPAGTRRITVMLVDVTRSGTSNILVQLGDSGGVETASYTNVSSVLINAAAVGTVSSTAGWVVSSAGSSAAVHTGSVYLNLEESTGVRWVGTGTMARTDSATIWNYAGAKALSATLDRVRITMANGTDTFTAGVINISYE